MALRKDQPHPQLIFYAHLQMYEQTYHRNDSVKERVSVFLWLALLLQTHAWLQSLDKCFPTRVGRLSLPDRYQLPATGNTIEYRI